MPSTGNYRPSIEKLKRSLLTTFPQLEGVRFTNEWGGTMAFTRDFVPRWAGSRARRTSSTRSASTARAS
jgi:glycine/D-amino acid oxidase-like deaminating enzyme